MENLLKEKKIALEKSTNTHILESNLGFEKIKQHQNGIISLKTKDDVSMITHGEHATLGLESKFLVKYIQQEYNPVTKEMMNCID